MLSPRTTHLCLRGLTVLSLQYENGFYCVGPNSNAISGMYRQLLGFCYSMNTKFLAKFVGRFISTNIFALEMAARQLGPSLMPNFSLCYAK